MKIGMMWSWETAKNKNDKTLLEHIKDAQEHHLNKYGRTPSECEINIEDYNENKTIIDDAKSLGVIVKPVKYILRNNIFIGSPELNSIEGVKYGME